MTGLERVAVDCIDLAAPNGLEELGIYLDDLIVRLSPLPASERPTAPHLHPTVHLAEVLPHDDACRARGAGEYFQRFRHGLVDRATLYQQLGDCGNTAEDRVTPGQGTLCRLERNGAGDAAGRGPQ